MMTYSVSHHAGVEGALTCHCEDLDGVASSQLRVQHFRHTGAPVDGDAKCCAPQGLKDGVANEEHIHALMATHSLLVVKCITVVTEESRMYKEHLRLVGCPDLLRHLLIQLQGCRVLP